MNRANQAALFQQTNQGLLNIRQSELTYYINLNIAFGTQAALIGGFTYGVFTQNQYNEDIEYAELFQNIYWVTSAGTIAASVHVIITTMLLQVLGPGLALHGPIGSMAKANEGMRKEQRAIITAFIIMMILFSLSTVLSFWAVMSFYSSIGSTAMFAIAGRYWYLYCERIYLRFYWETDDHKDDFGDHPHHKDSIDMNDIAPQEPQVPEKYRKRSFSKKGTKSNEKKSNKSIFGRLRWGASNKKEVENPDLLKNLIGDSQHGEYTDTDNEHFPRNHSVPIPPIVTSSRHISMEGYLLKKGHPNHKLLISASDTSASWERRYFVLYDTCQLFYYKSRQDFRMNPKLPMYKRALWLHDFMIEIFNSEFDIRRDSGVSTYFDSSRMSENDVVNAMYGGLTTKSHSLTGNAAVAHPHSPAKDKKFKFQITLIPKENTGDNNTVATGHGSDNMSEQETDRKGKREPWVLRCDTEEELEMWTVVMRELSPDSFRF